MGFCAPCRYSDQGALLLSGYCRINDTSLCTFWSRSGSLHGAAWSVLAERRRNEASSSREGGGRLAVRSWLVFGAGRCGDEGSAGHCQLACAPGRLRKRSEAECSASVVLGALGWLGAKAEREPAVLLFRNLRRMEHLRLRVGVRASGWLRKRSEAECGACAGSFPLNSAYRLSGVKA